MLINTPQQSYQLRVTDIMKTKFSHWSVKVFLVTIGHICVCAQQLLTPIVSTDKGDVRGVYLNTVIKNQNYSSFKGIRYAKPPLGKLRFKV